MASARSSTRSASSGAIRRHASSRLDDARPSARTPPARSRSRAPPAGAGARSRWRRRAAPAARAPAACAARWRPRPRRCPRRAPIGPFRFSFTPRSRIELGHRRGRAARRPGSAALDRRSDRRAALELAEHRAQVVEHQRRQREAPRHHRERPARVRDANTAPPSTCASTCSGGSTPSGRGGVHRLEQLRASSPRARARSGSRSLAPAERPAASSENRRAGVARELAETRRGALGSERPGIERQNSAVPLSRISWLVTVAICLIAARCCSSWTATTATRLVLLAVGAAAAVNLT